MSVHDFDQMFDPFVTKDEKEKRQFKMKVMVGNYEEFEDEEGKTISEGKKEEFVFMANKKPEEIQNGYKQTCKLSGISLHHDLDTQTLFANKGDYKLPFYLINKLRNVDVNISFIYDITRVKPKEVAILYMEMARAHIPDLDFREEKNFNKNDTMCVLNPNKMGKCEPELLGYGVYYD